MMNKDEFARAVERSRQNLYYAALSVLCSTEDARDAVADGIAYAWEHLSKLRDESKFDAWLLHITYTQAKLIRRKNKPHEDVYDYRDAFSYEDDTSGVEFFDILSRAPLNELERRILTLRFLYGCTLTETADMIGKPVGYTKMKYYRALRKLADTKGLI